LCIFFAWSSVVRPGRGVSQTYWALLVLCILLSHMTASMLALLLHCYVEDSCPEATSDSSDYQPVCSLPIFLIVVGFLYASHTPHSNVINTAKTSPFNLLANLLREDFDVVVLVAPLRCSHDGECVNKRDAALLHYEGAARPMFYEGCSLAHE
jgi:hypothetical protein